IRLGELPRILRNRTSLCPIRSMKGIVLELATDVVVCPARRAGDRGDFAKGGEVIDQTFRATSTQKLFPASSTRVKVLLAAMTKSTAPLRMIGLKLPLAAWLCFMVGATAFAYSVITEPACQPVLFIRFICVALTRAKKLPSLPQVKLFALLTSEPC